VHRVFEQLADGGHLLDLDEATVAALVELGLLVAEGDRSRPVGFAVPLPDAVRSGRRVWRINPSVRRTFAPPGAPFRPGPVVEVHDSERRAELAYWLDPEQAAALDEILDGRRPDDLPDHVVGALAAADVLVDHDDLARRRRQVTCSPVTGPSCITLRSLLPPPYVRAMQEYTRSLVTEGHLELGDAQGDRRYVAHNDAVAHWLHRRLLGAVQARVLATIRPSYSYLLAYLEGAQLAPHTDRAQCELTVSLAVDATPDESVEGAWPLHIRQTPDSQPVAVMLAPGDAVLFTGRQLEHHRDRLAAGRTSASLLLHFVDTAFTDSLD
jgi:hypothetical protein